MPTTPRSQQMTISRRDVLRLGGACLATVSWLPPAAPHAELAPNRLLHPVQELDTSGARAVMPFRLEGQLYLAIPHLALDIDGQPANMNGGDSDISLIVYPHQ